MSARPNAGSCRAIRHPVTINANPTTTPDPTRPRSSIHALSNAYLRKKLTPINRIAMPVYSSQRPPTRLSRSSGAATSAAAAAGAGASTRVGEAASANGWTGGDGTATVGGGDGSGIGGGGDGRAIGGGGDTGAEDTESTGDGNGPAAISADTDRVDSRPVSSAPRRARSRSTSRSSRITLMKLQKGRTSRPSAIVPATRPIKANT